MYAMVWQNSDANTGEVIRCAPRKSVLCVWYYHNSGLDNLRALPTSKEVQMDVDAQYQCFVG